MKELQRLLIGAGRPDASRRRGIAPDRCCPSRAGASRKRIASQSAAVSLALAVATACPAAQGTPSATGTGAAIDSLFSRFDRPDSPGCTVGVSDHGRTVHLKGYGMANLDWSMPNAGDTQFEVGSITKQFTAFAILSLERKGRLSLGDDVRRHLPELPDYGRPVTLDHLMRHTSGLPEFVALASFAARPPLSDIDNRSAIALLRKMRSPVRPAGQDFSYSNSGYLLLAEVVERVAGTSLAEYLDEVAFGPLGMSRSALRPGISAPSPRRATGYARAGAGYLRVVVTNGVVGPKGLETTVPDLLRWADNLNNPRIAPETVRAMSGRGRLTDGGIVAYGGGLTLGSQAGRRTERHQGQIGGFTSDLVRYPESKVSIAVLCNGSDLDAVALSDAVAATYFGDGPVAPSDPVARPDERLRAALGIYIDEDGRVLQLVEEGGALYSPTLSSRPLRSSGRDLVTDSRPTGTRIALADGGLRVTAGPNPYVLYRRFEAVSPTRAELSAAAGSYLNSDLGVVVELRPTDTGLELLRPDGVAVVLRPTLAGGFIGAGGMVVRLEGDARGAAAMSLFTPQYGRLRFERLDALAAPPTKPAAAESKGGDERVRG